MTERYAVSTPEPSLKPKIGVSPEGRVLFWLAMLVIFGALIHVLSDVLLPFIAGMAVAYFLDPIADKLEEKGLSRTLATTVITLTFFFVIIAVLGLLLPALHKQVVELAALVPEVIKSAKAFLEPHVRDIIANVRSRAGGAEEFDLQQVLSKYTGNALKWLAAFFDKLLSGGAAVLNLLSLIIITPIVSFYLLRDWDRIVEKLDGYLPLDHADDIRGQMRNIDMTLSGFVRGQASVCLTLSIFYAAGLSAIGLNSGLLVGIGAGLISFIPYIGAASGAAVALAIAFFQFGLADPLPIIAVAAVFLAGQTLESYVLTPKLVGDRIGLHPVWIMFALLAGGALFGFTGVLLAIPMAAVIGVLIRFAANRYQASGLYTGERHD